MSDGKAIVKKIYKIPGMQAIIALAVIVIFFSIASSSYRNFGTYASILQHSAILGIVACGSTLILISGGLDLSVGSIMALTTCFVGIILTNNNAMIVPAILAGTAIGGVCGLVNGTIIVTTGIPAIIVTMGMMNIAKGIALIIGAGKDLSKFPEEFTMLGTGLIFPMIFLLASALLVFFILTRTRLGFNAYAIGGKEEVARLSGIKVKKMRVIYYTLGGLFAGLAGTIQTAKFDFASPNRGVGWELQAIAAVVIGGTSLFGGIGGVWRTIIGVLIIKSLDTGLIHLGVGSYYQKIATGIVIILAVMVDSLQRKKHV
jgi:ribose/xylose/arabinose/galactoside ABC-type transport system permease subunit